MDSSFQPIFGRPIRVDRAAALGGKPVAADEPAMVEELNSIGGTVGNGDCEDRMEVCIGISVAAIRADRLGDCHEGGCSRC